MLHASLTPFGVVRGTNRELVEAAAAALVVELVELSAVDLDDLVAA